MFLRKIILFSIIVVFTQSCKNCTLEYFPYIHSFRLNNQNADSISNVRLYFYSNNSNFSKVIDSITVSKRKYNNDVEFEFTSKSDTLKSFNYKVYFTNNALKEFKVKIIEDACENCKECDERKYPKTIEINGIRVSNNSNIIHLN